VYEHALPFSDREDAGRRLAAVMKDHARDRPVVLGLTRGGIPVAAPVARALNAPLDMIIVRKVGAPFQPELGIGALAEGSVQVIDTVLCRQLGITEDTVVQMVRAQARELDSRIAFLRRSHPRTDLADRAVIIVDDGLATGSTAHAAVRSARRAGARSITLAVPVGSVEAIRRLEQVADEVVCLSTPPDFVAVGQHYGRFAPVDDLEMLGTLMGGADADVVIPAGETLLPGTLTVPPRARLLVIFAHGSGSSRLSPRNRAVAEVLQAGGIATLLMDLLTEDEARDPSNVFDVDHLADRLEAALAWSRTHTQTQHLSIGLFGASTGAAAALAVAARCPDLVRSVASRGGRPDLAAPWLPRVMADTLLIVGGDDVEVLRLNREAQSRMRCRTALEVIPGAGHLFEEPGTLQRVAELARDWFARSAAARAA